MVTQLQIEQQNLQDQLREKQRVESIIRDPSTTTIVKSQARRELNQVNSEINRLQGVIQLLQTSPTNPTQQPQPGRLRSALGNGWQGAVNFGKSHKGFKSFDHDAHPIWVALIAWGLHLYDGIVLGFNRGPAEAGAMFLAYGLFAAWMIFAYYRTGFHKDSLRYVMISLFAFFLPYSRALFDLLPFNVSSSSQMVWIFYLFLPVWFFEIAHTTTKDGHKWMHWIADGILIGETLILVFMALSTITPVLPTIGSAPVNIGQSFNSFTDTLSASWFRFTEAWQNTGVTSINSLQTRIANTFNPQIILYGGVEEEGDIPVGVHLSNVQSIQDRYLEGTGPAITATLEAYTFTDESLALTPFCSLLGPKYDVPRGDLGLAPGETIELNRGLFRTLTCEFDDDPGLVRGTYSATIGATFPFVTYAYIFNTFVSKETIFEYSREGSDIHAALDIPPRTEAVFTGGPVELGMMAANQPIDIDINDVRGDYIKQRFGFTIRNKWPKTQGTINEVYKIEVLIPQQFELGDCLRAEHDNGEILDGLRKYTFTKNIEALTAGQDFSTFSCELKIPTKEEALQLLNFGEKTPTTFVVAAHYTYTLQRKVPIRVVDII